MTLTATPETGDSVDLASGPLRTLMVLGIVVANLLSSLPRLDIGSRQLFDTDGYMRAVRVLDLVTGRNGWFDGWVHQANAPFGHSMHWTRLLDAVLIGLGSPLAPFVGWRDAIYFAAIALGPLLHVGVGLAVAWTAKPLTGPGAAYLAGLAVAVQSGILSYSSAGRPDHHILLLLLAVVVAGCAVRMMEQSATGLAKTGGLVAAAGLWISTEFLAPLGLVLTALIVRWLITGRIRLEIFWFGRALFAGTALFLLLERGIVDLHTVEYDRLSVVHLTVAGLVWAVFELSPRIRGPAPRVVRLAVVGGLAAVGFLIVTLTFPRFWAGPFVDVPGELQAYWLDRVAELAPLWSAASHRWTDLMFLIGSTLIGLGFAVAATRSSIRQDRMVGPWLFVGFWLVVTAALAIRNVRFIVYPEAMAAIPTAWWAGAYLGRLRQRGLIRSLKRVAAMALVIVGFTLPAGVARALEGAASDSSTAGDCSLRDVIPYVESAIRASDQRLPVILAAIDSGPELLWRLPVRIVADPYHRNVQGILDARSILGSDDWAIAQELLVRHDVRYVLVCDGDPEGGAFGAGTFYRALLTRDPPPGLTLVHLSGSFLIYAANWT